MWRQLFPRGRIIAVHLTMHRVSWVVLNECLWFLTTIPIGLGCNLSIELLKSLTGRWSPSKISSNTTRIPCVSLKGEKSITVSEEGHWVNNTSMRVKHVHLENSLFHLLQSQPIRKGNTGTRSRTFLHWESKSFFFDLLFCRASNSLSP